jgi:hypothetical protein
MLSQMCSNRNNPEEFVTANPLLLPEQLQFIAGCWPPDLLSLGRLGTGGELGAVLPRG